MRRARMFVGFAAPSACEGPAQRFGYKRYDAWLERDRYFSVLARSQERLERCLTPTSTQEGFQASGER